MNLFGKKKKEVNVQQASQAQTLSSLPSLPKLPEFPRMNENDNDFFQNQTSQLPSYPSNYSGERFSRNAIKEAVSGKEEDDEEVLDADESQYDEDDDEMMQEPREFRTKRYEDYDGGMKTQKSLEPVFVRIDEFEEGLEIFNKSKSKISEIEKLLADLRRVNEKEERELKKWEEEVQAIKKNFEKMDKNIFSKI